MPRAMTYEHMFGSHVAEEWYDMHACQEAALIFRFLSHYFILTAAVAV